MLGAMLLRRWASLALLLPPAPAEWSCSASWAAQRNLSSKSSNFGRCGSYSLPHGKGLKLAAKRQHRLFGTKKSISQLLYLGTCICHPLATHEDEELMHTIMSPSVLQLPGEESWVAQGKRHSNFQHTPNLSPYLLYKLGIASKVITASKPETQESFNMNTTLVFHCL